MNEKIKRLEHDKEFLIDLLQSSNEERARLMIENREMKEEIAALEAEIEEMEQRHEEELKELREYYEEEIREYYRPVSNMQQLGLSMWDFI